MNACCSPQGLARFISVVSTGWTGRCLLVAVMFVVGPSTAVAQVAGKESHDTLINMGEIWRVRKVPFQLEKPARDWTERGFNDSSWERLIPGVDLHHSHAALQDAQVHVVPSRVFMRTTFQVGAGSRIRSLRLRVEHELGFKAYLNGRVIADHPAFGMVRQKLTLSSGVEEEIKVHVAEIDISAHRTLLTEGENVLALEGSQRLGNTREVSLAGLLSANFSRGPFIQNSTPTSTVIVWRTDLPCSSIVEFGEGPGLGRRVEDIDAKTDHAITLEGLRPDTLYHYRVAGYDEVGRIESGRAFFRTFKESGPVRFVFTADTGQNTVAQFSNARIMADLMPDLVIHGGDIIYGGFDDQTPDTRIFAQYHRHTGQMWHTPFYFTIGNHDINCCGGNTAEWNPTNMLLNAPSFQATFHHPRNSVTGTEHFYSFDHGDAHFVGLYNPWFEVYDFHRGTEQYRWLTNDLAMSKKPWKILFFHSPMMHSGAHSQADRNRNFILDQAELAQLLSDPSVPWAPDLVLCGHEHNYERFVPTNGVHTVVSGGGGAGLYSFVRRHPNSAQFYSVNHCLSVELSGDTAAIQSVGTNGVIIDQFVINRSPPRRVVYDASWNSPQIESVPADDGDGNIQGQAFDFVGDPILGRHGKFSNPGFFYVNNDSTHLYLGFAGVMIPDDATLFLFLESPGSAGRQTLEGLGDGVINPLAEGVDGLDCLENLDFQGFRPDVALVLGDERADGTLRSYRRPRLDLDTGQGAFRLVPGLPSIPGVKIQQYNRSPQTNTVPVWMNGASEEQNADYIEVGIPLSELGTLKPGGEFKLGALVGLRGFDQSQQTRVLDSTVLGMGLASSGLRSVLSPITIRLSTAPTLDADADGLPDSWEISFGLRADSGAGDDGASGDPDLDGANNVAELVAGTDPRDAASALKLSLDLAGDRGVRLSFPARPGRSYLLQAGDGSLDRLEPYRRFVNEARLRFTPMTLLDPLRGARLPAQRTYRLLLEEKP